MSPRGCPGGERLPRRGRGGRGWRWRGGASLKGGGGRVFLDRNEKRVGSLLSSWWTPAGGLKCASREGWAIARAVGNDGEGREAAWRARGREKSEKEFSFFFFLNPIQASTNLSTHTILSSRHIFVDTYHLVQPPHPPPKRTCNPNTCPRPPPRIHRRGGKKKRKEKD